MLSDLTIAPVDPVLANQVRHAIDIKTKPPGSLGQIEAAALALALAALAVEATGAVLAVSPDVPIAVVEQAAPIPTSTTTPNRDW
jgi:nicotinate-nucleotide--dimethylbenzimidazole phosphoribosyltransferase